MNGSTNLYENGKKYIYISYAHADSETVMRFVRTMQERGLRVWYDNGEDGELLWPETIAAHLKFCEIAMFFITENFVKSKNCLREVIYAQNNDKLAIAVFLQENIEMPDDLDYYIGSVQSLFACRYGDLDAAIDKLCKSQLVSECSDFDTGIEYDTETDEAEKHLEADNALKIYEGEEKYIFISYSHEDYGTVMSFVEKMQERRGFRIWCDKGIEVGTEWPKTIAEHLKSCEIVIFFITENFVKSKNCLREVIYAQNNNKQSVSVFLQDNVELPSGLDLQLNSEQWFPAYRSVDIDAAIDKLCKAYILGECTDQQTDLDYDSMNPETEKEKKKNDKRAKKDRRYLKWGFIPGIGGICLGEYSRIFDGNWSVTYWMIMIGAYTMLISSLHYRIKKHMEELKPGKKKQNALYLAIMAAALINFFISLALFYIKAYVLQ